MKRPLSFVFILLFLCAVLAPPSGHTEEIKEEYEKIQEKIKTGQEKLKKAKHEERSIIGELERLNGELSDVERSLENQRKALGRIKRRIAAIKGEIASTKARLERKKELIKRKLRAMHKQGPYRDAIILVGSSEDIQGLLKMLKYLESLSVAERRMLEKYKNDLKELTEKEQKLEGLYAELKTGEKNIRVSEDELKGKREGKKQVLASVKNERASYEKMLKELNEASQKLIELLRKSDKEAESYKGKGFRGLKGSLPWPADGSIAIGYGSQKDPEFNTPVFRNGIYIKADEGAPAKAVYEGKVVYADWFKGYGKLVIVNHGEGYNTLYANLSEIFLKVGDIIKGKEEIGKVGESSTVNAPSLYFEVRYKGRPLDPTQWLKRR
jgi:septal ring factor EnvC (AmiA/AmiB activator)